MDLRPPVTPVVITPPLCSFGDSLYIYNISEYQMMPALELQDDHRGICLIAAGLETPDISHEVIVNRIKFV